MGGRVRNLSYSIILSGIIALSIPMLMIFSGYFCLTINDFSSFSRVSSTCSTETIVLSQRARVYGIVCYVLYVVDDRRRI